MLEETTAHSHFTDVLPKQPEVCDDTSFPSGALAVFTEMQSGLLHAWSHLCQEYRDLVMGEGTSESPVRQLVPRKAPESPSPAGGRTQMTVRGDSGQCPLVLTAQLPGVPGPGSPAPVRV